MHINWRARLLSGLRLQTIQFGRLLRASNNDLGNHSCARNTISLSLSLSLSEPCKLQPSVIEVILKNTAQVIRKVPRKNIEAPLKGCVC